MCKKIKKISFDELIQFLDKKYKQGALIKIFRDEKYAIDFQNGHICMGTLNYYRNIEDSSDKRCDKLESITNPTVIGYCYTIEGKKIQFTQTSGLTGLALCLFYYNENKEYLEKAIKDLGRYICILDYQLAETFYYYLADSKFEYSLSNQYDDIKFNWEGGDNKKVVYCENPDYSGFQKRITFIEQQEYRYIFSLKHLRTQLDNVDDISERFIFNVNMMPHVDTFEIIL